MDVAMDGLRPMGGGSRGGGPQGSREDGWAMVELGETASSTAPGDRHRWA